MNFTSIHWAISKNCKNVKCYKGANGVNRENELCPGIWNIYKLACVDSGTLNCSGYILRFFFVELFTVDIFLN